MICVIVVGLPQAIDNVTGQYNNSGRVAVYQRATGIDNVEYRQDNIAELVIPNPAENLRFGESLAVSDNGKIIAVGAPGYNNKRGAVYLYERENTVTNWLGNTDEEVTKVDFSDSIINDVDQINEFGKNIAMSEDGETLFVYATKIFNYSTYISVVYIYKCQVLDGSTEPCKWVKTAEVSNNLGIRSLNNYFGINFGSITSARNGESFIVSTGDKSGGLISFN